MQILCATDFSSLAVSAANIAAGLAKKLHLPLRLLHCGPDWVVMGEMPMVEPDDDAFRLQLTREADRLRATGISVDEDFRRGTVSDEIVAAAAAQPTRLIVLGSSGSGGGRAERWLGGNVTERVAESAPVPTLVVRTPSVLQSWIDGAGPLRLFGGVDFTMSADTAMADARTFLSLGNVEVEAAHVRHREQPAVSPEQHVVRQRDVWERVRPILGDTPVKVHVCYADEQPALTFLDASDEQLAGLIVVGTHQRHGLDRLRAPSFSRTVLTHAHTNVLCVPAALGQPDTRIPSIQRVLLATDFSEVCTDALRHAHSLLPRGGSIHIIHVCPDPRSGINPVIATEVYFDNSLNDEEVRQEASAKLKALPEALLNVPGVSITSEVVTHHDVTSAICDAAERSGAHAICMGAKGHSRMGAALLGSTVQDVIARAHKPVFVVTPPRV